MLNTIVLLVALIALANEIIDSPKVAKWIKAHFLNLAVIADIMASQGREALEAIHHGALNSEALGTVVLVVVLVGLSYVLKRLKARKAVRLAAAVVAVAENTV